MGMDKNLHDVMNDVSARLERRGCTPRRLPRGEVISELQAFAALDPLLFDLRKQYFDAKSTRTQSEKDFGIDDCMTDMAMIEEDSAWCAMQTRYMELRSDRALMMKAQALIMESICEQERLARAEREEEARKISQQMDLLLRMRDAQNKKDEEDWLLALLLLWSGRNFMPVFAAPQFNRLAA